VRQIVFPDDPAVRSVFGHGLTSDCTRARRAYRARLERAIAKGTLPRPVWTSPRIWGFDRNELEATLAQLPRSYASFASMQSEAPV
jgi:hypothetical protein